MISEEAVTSFGKNILSPSNNLISLVGSLSFRKEVKSITALCFPPPFPMGISLIISMRDKSVLEVIPPAFLSALEIVVKFSDVLFIWKFCLVVLFCAF